MKLKKEEVEHVGKLARLHLTEDETDVLSQQLSSILTYMDALNEVNTEGIEQMASVLGQANVSREDNILPSLPTEKVVVIAPDSHNGFFRVPQIIADR
jgi:aspartyl-tRNA(Asn)/glutamyl-tRNA(Gln) amidotransferase subunit C